MKKFLTAIAAVLLFISCDTTALKDKSALENIMQKSEEYKVEDIQYDKQDTGFYPAGTSQSSLTVANQNAKINWDKKIIKNADIKIEVKDFKKYNAALYDLVSQFGGYVAQEEQATNDYKIENTAVLKVPVEQFEALLTSLTSNVDKLIEKKINSKDVTGEMFDTKSRIEAKKQIRLRYLDFLKQAKNVQEVLSVQSEINGIQEEIESASGRLSFLSHNSVLSTIRITFYQVLDVRAIEKDNPSFGSKLNNAFRNGLEWIGEIFVGLVTIWPLCITILFGLLLFVRFRNKKCKAG